MCAIWSLLPGQSIDDKMLDNVVGNNLDGWGIVLHDVDAKRLEIKRGFDSQGTDPETIARILEDNNDLVRHVHVRNTTKGANSLDNTHPFCVYSDNNRQVYCLHNGTLHDFGRGNDQRSDTKVFCEDFLSPLLSRYHGEFGPADYNDPILKGILEKYVGYNNRVMLVSNDLEPLRIGTWKEVSSSVGHKFLASNDDYFKNIIRGPRRPLAVVPSSGTTTGSAAKTTTTGSNLVYPPQNKQVPLSPTTAKQEGSKENEKKVTPLSEVRRELIDFKPSNTLLEALGIGASNFEEWGFESFSWVRDEEIEVLLKAGDKAELVQMFRCLVDGIMSLSADVDMASSLIQRLKNGEDDDDDLGDEQLELQVQGLEESVSDLVATNTTLGGNLVKVNAQLAYAQDSIRDLEETNRNLLGELKTLKQRNRLYSNRVNYLSQCLQVKGIPVPPIDINLEAESVDLNVAA